MFQGGRDLGHKHPAAVSAGGEPKRGCGGATCPSPHAEYGLPADVLPRICRAAGMGAAAGRPYSVQLRCPDQCPVRARGIAVHGHPGQRRGVPAAQLPAADGDAGRRSAASQGGRRPGVGTAPPRPSPQRQVLAAGVAAADRKSLARSCVRPPGNGVACGFQVMENGRDAQRIRVGARRGGAQW